MSQRTLVLVPTYDERENLVPLVERVHALRPEVDVLVIDDDSPDGTGELADTLAAADPRVRVLHRERKEGLGRAYLAGFGYALEEGYDLVVQMDADGSHQPEQLDRLLRAVDEGADVVIGSRWVRGGTVLNWPRHRQALSVGANLYTALALGVAVRDATAGYRVYRADALRALSLDEVASQGYCFQIDLTRRADAAGLRIREVPIDFVERELGESKMDTAIIRESLARVASWGWQRRRGQARRVADAGRRGVADLLRRREEAAWHRLAE